jgi:hypothetical protein
MAKSKVYELLLLASLCEPSDMVLKKQMLLAKIAQSDEYAELRNREAFHEVFAASFTPAVLAAQDVPALERTFSVIKLLPSVLTELLYSLQNGYGPKLTPLDKPDFNDAEQLTALLRKLEGTHLVGI